MWFISDTVQCMKMNYTTDKCDEMDTLASIAKGFGLPADQILALNKVYTQSPALTLASHY